MFRLALAFFAAAASVAAAASPAAANETAAVPRCTSAQLGTTIYLQGAGGSLAGAMRVVNGGRRCSLGGRPQISAFSATGRRLLTRTGASPPRWQLASRSRPRGWPSVVLERNQKADIGLVVRNWCGRSGARVTFRALAGATGELSAATVLRLRCDAPGAGLSLSVGPFEPVSSG